MRGGGMEESSAAPGLKKGPWTAAEDAVLVEYVRKHGEGNWNAVQKNSGLWRCGKSCRLRWANHLRPNLKKGSFSPEEELLILRLHSQLGNKWARMAAQLPGRTDNEIKNYWNTRIKRRHRAGLPLYPPEILRQAVAASASINQPSVGLSATTSLTPNPFPAKPVLELPTIKRFRGTSLFPFPTSSSPIAPLTPSQLLYHHHPYNLGDYNIDRASVKAELPSSQCKMFLGAGGSNSGLLDALLHDAAPDQSQNCVKLASMEGNCDNGALGLDSRSKPDGSHCIIETKATTELGEEMNPDLLLNMFPTSAMAPLKMASSNSYGGYVGREASNEGQSSAVTDDEMQQQLASVAPAERGWSIGSCSWNNMPRIC